MHIQAYSVEDGNLATDVALPIYIRHNEYFDPVWNHSLSSNQEYDSARHDFLLDYLHHFQQTPRTHLFAIEIAGAHARLVRCDHAGVVASSAFKWKEDAFYLSEFIHRMGQLSDDGLGLDTTWSAATPEETAIALAAVRADDPEGDYSVVTVKKLLLLNDVTPNGEEPAYDVLAVLTPSSYARPELVGRYNMGFRAYCPKTQAVIWVKDSWTRDEASVEPEGVTMRKLHAEGVPHLARVHSAGYVRDARDRIQLTLSGCPKFKSDIAMEVKYTHYRIAFRDIGRPLPTFRSTQELVIVLRDAIQGLSVCSPVSGVVN